MKAETKCVPRCLACGSPSAKPAHVRKDGIRLLRCLECSSLYLEQMPVDVTALYTDNYFALEASHAERNQNERVGYEGSYEDTYMNCEFYWAYRLADFIAQSIQGGGRIKRCLDIGAATGRLLNVFKSLGYDTHGIEFSRPARSIAERRGHTMYDRPAEALDELADKFPVVTALEVIEHLEDLPNFFSDVHRLMTDNGVFMGYFPSANERWFGTSGDYHWLNNSLEHLIYPSEEGIRRALRKSFGDNVFMATFMTVQGNDVIPFTIVVAIKGHAAKDIRLRIAELFRQLRYLTDLEFVHDTVGPAALAAQWEAEIKCQQSESPADIPFVAALLCSKLGMFGIPLFLMRRAFSIEDLTIPQIVDLLAMAQHLGGIHFMRDLLITVSERELPYALKQEFQHVVDQYELRHPDTAKLQEATPK